MGDPEHMNATRRKKIEEALALVTECKDAEQEAYDNMPESFQEGTRGDAMQEHISNLEDAVTALQAIVDTH